MCLVARVRFAPFPVTSPPTPPIHPRAAPPLDICPPPAASFGRRRYPSPLRATVLPPELRQAAHPRGAFCCLRGGVLPACFAPPTAPVVLARFSCTNQPPPPLCCSRGSARAAAAAAAAQLQLEALNAATAPLRAELEALRESAVSFRAAARARWGEAGECRCRIPSSLFLPPDSDSTRAYPTLSQSIMRHRVMPTERQLAAAGARRAARAAARVRAGALFGRGSDGLGAAVMGSPRGRASTGGGGDGGA